MRQLTIFRTPQLQSWEVQTKKWAEYFETKGFKVIIVNSINGKGLSDVIKVSKEIMKEKIENDRLKGRIYRPIRAMIVGIPNVGKSTFINKFVGKAVSQTGDKPGVTKGKQWIKIKKDFELLDTPGILWPKFEDEQVALKLAFTGAIKDEIMDIQTLSYKFIDFINNLYPEAIKQRYKIEFDSNTQAYEIFDMIAKKRGFIRSGKNTRGFSRGMNCHAIVSVQGKLVCSRSLRYATKKLNC